MGKKGRRNRSQNGKIVHDVVQDPCKDKVLCVTGYKSLSPFQNQNLIDELNKYGIMVVDFTDDIDMAVTITHQPLE